jgi:hypothetical protein
LEFPGRRTSHVRVCSFDIKSFNSHVIKACKLF